jgi:hypothetical protein
MRRILWICGWLLALIVGAFFLLIHKPGGDILAEISAAADKLKAELNRQQDELTKKTVERNDTLGPIGSTMRFLGAPALPQTAQDVVAANTVRNLNGGKQDARQRF